jgi:hypothetical protein
MQGEHCLYFKNKISSEPEFVNDQVTQESIPGTPVRQAGNRLLDSLKDLKIRAQRPFLVLLPHALFKKKNSNVTVCFVALGLKDSTLCTAHSTTILKFNR